MIIREVKTKKEKKEYIDFIYKLYENDKKYCDMNITFVKNFLYKKGCIHSSKALFPKDKKSVLL